MTDGIAEDRGQCACAVASIDSICKTVGDDLLIFLSLFFLLTQDSSLRASCLLLLEAAVEGVLRTGDWPTECVQRVVADVSRLVTGGEEPNGQVLSYHQSLSLYAFQLIVTKMCKVYVSCIHVCF